MPEKKKKKKKKKKRFTYIKLHLSKKERKINVIVLAKCFAEDFEGNSMVLPLMCFFFHFKHIVHTGLLIMFQ